MGSMREALNRSGHNMVVGMLARKEAEEKRQREYEARKEARRLRDQAIMKIHELSYSRKLKGGGGKLVPRRKSHRNALDKAIMAARVYASLARPEHGYPRPPIRRDPDYPSVPVKQEGMDMNRLSTERNRLTFWLCVLESRGASEKVKANVTAHIERLQNKLNRMHKNDLILKSPGTKHYSLKPAASRAGSHSNRVVVENARTLRNG